MTSSRHFQDVLQLCVQDVFKTFSRRLGRQKNVTLKTSSRRLQYVFTKTNVCWVSSEFQHFKIKVRSKSMALFWFCVYTWVALILKKTKGMKCIRNVSEIHSSYFITQFIWNYPIQWFILIRTAKTSIESVLEKKCL